MIYHLCRPIRLSSLAVAYHLLWTIISYVAWHSSPADDYQLKQMILIWRGWYSSRADNIQLKQMIFICQGRYLSRADDIHSMETIFMQEKRKTSVMVDSWNCNQPLEMIFNHWESYSTTGNHNQPLGMIINHSADKDDLSSALDEYIICRKWIFQKIYLDPNYLPRKI
jgi:hypothetical protein